MSRSPKIIALLDANVLYPAPLRDYLLHLASIGVYEPVYDHSHMRRNISIRGLKRNSIGTSIKQLRIFVREQRKA